MTIGNSIIGVMKIKVKFKTNLPTGPDLRIMISQKISKPLIDSVIGSVWFPIINKKWK